MTFGCCCWYRDMMSSEYDLRSGCLGMPSLDPVRLRLDDEDLDREGVVRGERLLDEPVRRGAAKGSSAACVGGSDEKSNKSTGALIGACAI